MVDQGSKPKMGFIYQVMVNANNEIKANLKDVQTWYELLHDIIDERWCNQLNMTLHVAGCYFKPVMQNNFQIIHVPRKNGSLVFNVDMLTKKGKVMLIGGIDLVLTCPS
uniref:Uncharacterized protein n=1 Tax=Lactuca sativa TaxID=4236 RepID=A0A9R1WB16_LACSA|nr:hypothetical protein LSAT_V11C200059390 [Lactuca sativa]